MNLLIWTVQILLALHTFVGAMWKSSNSEQGVAALQAIPHGLWKALIIVEILCSLGLVLPVFFKKPVRKVVPIASACIAAEMLLFCALYAFSGSRESGEIAYWLVVAALCAFVTYGRWRLKPL